MQSPRSLIEDPKFEGKFMTYLREGFFFIYLRKYDKTF